MDNDPQNQRVQSQALPTCLCNFDCEMNLNLYKLQIQDSHWGVQEGENGQGSKRRVEKMSTTAIQDYPNTFEPRRHLRPVSQPTNLGDGIPQQCI